MKTISELEDELRESEVTAVWAALLWIPIMGAGVLVGFLLAGGALW